MRARRRFLQRSEAASPFLYTTLALFFPIVVVLIHELPAPLTSTLPESTTTWAFEPGNYDVTNTGDEIFVGERSVTSLIEPDRAHVAAVAANDAFQNEYRQMTHCAVCLRPPCRERKAAQIAATRETTFAVLTEVVEAMRARGFNEFRFVVRKTDAEGAR